MNFNWQKAKSASGGYQDIIYEKMDDIAKVTINRPEVRNAFRIENIFSMTDIIHLLFYNSRFNPYGIVLLRKYDEYYKHLFPNGNIP